jgi:two-component system sensor kinase FixL
VPAIDGSATAIAIGAQPGFEAIFDASPEPIAVVDDRGRIVLANRATLALFDYRLDDIVGEPLARLLPDPIMVDDELFERIGAAALVAAAGSKRELEGRRRNGSRFPLQLSLAVSTTDGATHFTAVMSDISRRRATESALANREAHLATLYSQSGAGLAETDRAGRFVAVNDRYCEILGRTREELLGLRLQDITHPEDLQHNLPLFTRLVTQGGAYSIEERYLRGDGSVVWVTKTASPIQIEGAESIALVIAIDVTERRMADEALRESEERLRLLHNEFAHLARVNDLGEMAAAIAHEVNQPLTAIANYLNAGLMFAEQGTTAAALADARDAMKRAAEQGVRAGLIVRGMREFVGKGVGNRKLCRADTLVETAMALALTDARRIAIRVEHRSEAGNAVVQADAVQIQQVLVNLLRNGVEALATVPAGGERRLTIVTRDQKATGMVEFCVADSGPGIAAEVRSRLFQPFVTSKPTGMGMGLSVCRRIVESHGGTIEAESPPHEGSTFRFFLPNAGHESGRGNNGFH